MTEQIQNQPNLQEATEQQYRIGNALTAIASNPRELHESGLDASSPWLTSPGGKHYLPGGEKILTNLPVEAFYVFDNPNTTDEHWAGSNPLAFDTVAPGDYSIYRSSRTATQLHVERDDNGDTFFIGYEDRNAVEDPDYSVMSLSDTISAAPIRTFANSYYERISTQLNRLRVGGMDELTIATYERFGFRRTTIRDDDYFMYPAPSTFVKLAKQNNIPVALCGSSNGGKKPSIPDEEYNANYAATSYAVGVADLDFYMHDLTNDHLPGILLGGKPLLDLLAPIAQKGVEVGKAQDIARSIDILTPQVTDILRIFTQTGSGERTVDALHTVEKAYQKLALENGIEVEIGAMSNVILNGLNNLIGTMESNGSYLQNLAHLLEKYHAYDFKEQLLLEQKQRLQARENAKRLSILG